MGFLSSLSGEDRTSLEHSESSESTHVSVGASIVPRINSEFLPGKQANFGARTGAAEQCVSSLRSCVMSIISIIYPLRLVSIASGAVHVLSLFRKARHVQGELYADPHCPSLVGHIAHTSSLDLYQKQLINATYQHRHWDEATSVNPRVLQSVSLNKSFSSATAPARPDAHLKTSVTRRSRPVFNSIEYDSISEFQQRVELYRGR